jgi:GT2 family glycosyltransferase
VGITLALERGYEAVLLLNNDCEIVGADLLELLRQMRADPLIAAISPLIYCSDNRTKPQVVGGWLDWSSHRSIRPSDPDIRIPDKATPVIPGTALLLRCSALVEIGLLDDRYFAYYEDNDISARIAAHGMTATFCKTASAWHRSRPVDGYSSTALYLSARNAWIFWHAYSPENFRIGLSRHLLAQSFYEIASLKKAGAHDKCKAVTAGLWDAYRGKNGRPPSKFGPPAWLNALMVVAPYLMYDLLTSPRNAIASRLKRK